MGPKTALAGEAGIAISNGGEGWNEKVVFLIKRSREEELVGVVVKKKTGGALIESSGRWKVEEGRSGRLL